MNESIKKENALKSKRQVPQQISARVGQEILKSEYEPSTWARALSSAEGDHEAVVAEYARLRIAQLMRAQTKDRKKVESLERRRLNSCLGVKTVKDILNGIGKVGVVNIPRPRVPWIWMLLMVLGVAGCVAAFSRLTIGEIPAAIRIWIPIFSLGCGFLVVLVMILSSQFFSRAFVAWVWGPGIVGLSSVVCIGSLLLGTKLMMENPFTQPSGSEVTHGSSEVGLESAQLIKPNSLNPGITMPVITRVAVTE